MSMHKIPITEMELKGLVKYGLTTNKPSQMSDSFRNGIQWAADHYAARLNSVESQRDELLAALKEVNNTIYVAGAPHGSDNYFHIRRTVCEAITKFEPNPSSPDL